MTSREIVLVQESFSKLAPIADQAAALFFVRLFELDPSLRRCCQGEREQQGRGLVRLLASSIHRLARLERLQPALRRLGHRQAAHGTRDEHYAFSGAALLWTLEKALGPEFTPPVKAAWTQFYVVLANAMLDGAHRHELAA
ncbi:globin domain-containing protein [Opitutus terrae]|uniref:Globin n=1 Tax=Opitutus terrae (strain DSM 11246 / JCM 15787 / PB90-1) TaxID=452637 RepID=B1ZVJ7_OPITP|nr:globin domain-containing protein [Opitutus terrae]ACB74094.1 globin [Opitutus terrae PB90-1]